MKYNRSNHYDKHLIQSKIMGPNPIKLEEELLSKHKLFKDAVVMDLGCGHGITSIFLVKEYGFRVFSVDLWSNPSDNKRFFDEMGFSSKQIIPLKGDAASLPFAEEFFDGFFALEVAEDQTAVGGVVFLGAVDQGLGVDAQGFGLCQSGVDALVKNERYRHVGQQGVAVSFLAAEMVEFFIVSHRGD